MENGLTQQKLAVDSGHWPLYRFDPRRIDAGQSPLTIDSAEPKTPLTQFMDSETRFKSLKQMNPDRYQKLEAIAQEQVKAKYAQIKGIEESWKARLAPTAPTQS
jgi:pyruvate-ferredoxin/flavodoxin oxidoreductase